MATFRYKGPVGGGGTRTLVVPADGGSRLTFHDVAYDGIIDVGTDQTAIDYCLLAKKSFDNAGDPLFEQVT